MVTIHKKMNVSLYIKKHSVPTSISIVNMRLITAEVGTGVQILAVTAELSVPAGCGVPPKYCYLQTVSY